MQAKIRELKEIVHQGKADLEHERRVLDQERQAFAEQLREQAPRHNRASADV